MAINGVGLVTLGWFMDTGGSAQRPTGEEIFTFGMFDGSVTLATSTGRSCPPLPDGRGFTKQYSVIVPKGRR